MPLSYTGLTQSEAQKRLVDYGPNQIKEANRVTPLTILFRQIKGNFIIYLLAISAVISYAVAKFETMYTLFAVVAVVIIFGFIQEYKSEKAVAALRNMLTQFSTVLRDGREQQVASVSLVPGDIVLLRNGEKVPADCTVLSQKLLLVNEAILTGESSEIAKNADDTTIYMGSFIVSGHCTAQVITTGMNTRFGKIASMISGAEKELTLQQKINAIGKFTVAVGIVVSVATGALMFARTPSLDWVNVTEILILVVALAVSTFPEGLPVVLTTTLAVGAGRMARQNAIVNRMGVIETLGETTVICTDKTGTLTTGQMTVKQVYCGTNSYSVSGAGFNTEGIFSPSPDAPELQTMLTCAVACNDARIERQAQGSEITVIGSPTESALLVMAAKAGVVKEELQSQRLEEIPFSSERKMMSVLVSTKAGTNHVTYAVYAKGAPEVLVPKCTLLAKGGKELPFSEQNRTIIRTLINELAQNSYRTLALAYKRMDAVDQQDLRYQENDLVFLGLLAMEDPPREEVAQALQTAKIAGIEVKMITGDNIETAISIGKQIGLTGKALEGAQLDNLSDAELTHAVASVAIFARVRPEHKLRLVKALKQLGHIVAMTGDGVNDAPALKEAHVGIAMGKNGTDIARAVADVTLKDDNFATILAAIKEGRAVFNNIQKFVAFQLACNLAELLILFMGVLLAPVFGWRVPIITAIQILFMNLVTDSIPAVTLGFNPTSPDIMLAKPRTINGNNKIITRFTVWTLIYAGCLMALFSLIANYFSSNLWHQSQMHAATTTVAALICVEVISAFTFRSFRKPVLSRSPFINMPLLWAAVGSVVATLIIIYTPVRGFFETTPIGAKNWLMIAGLCLGISVIYDLAKLFNPQTQHA
jgi:Ca2+-transporting ATPase